MTASPRRVILLVALVTLSLVSTPAATWQQPSDLPLGPDTLVRHVRQALGRGAVARARALATETAAPAGTQAVARALVDLFEGRRQEARAALTPQADAGDPDALLELGVLELYEGHRTEGRRRLDALLQQNADMTPRHTFRLARAAWAIGDIRLANSLFQRVGTVPMQQADMETTWGDMLLEKHQAGEAVRSYRAAIEADATWVRAHLGLARALAAEDGQAADAAYEKAASLAPQHPDVWLWAAEQKLQAEDKDGATEALDEVAKRRSQSYEELALRAAVAYARGEFDAAVAMVDRAVQGNPFFTEGYLALGRQAARAYRFADAAAQARKAVALDAETPGPHADLGMYLMRVGDEAGARAELERAFRLDPYDTVAYNQLTLLDKIDSFVEIESGPFIFKFPPEEAEVLRPYALPLANEAYDTFVKRYGFTPEGPIIVEVFTRHDDFAVRTMGLPGLVGALGVCFGRVIAMDSPMTMRETASAPKFSWQATLWHEIAHVFSLQASDYKVPRWLTEGISVFEEHLKNPAWGRELALEYARALSQKRNFGVKGLPKAFERPQDLALAYFEASLLTEHLVSINGDAGVRALLAAYAGGAKDEAAFGQAFGKTVDDIDASFNAFVQERYGALAQAMGDRAVAGGPGARPTVDSLKAAVATNPGSYMAQWSLGTALLSEGDLAGARAALEKAASLAPMAQGDDSPRALLARIAEQEGDLARARAELRQLLTWDHDNVDAARKLVTLAKDVDLAHENFALRVIADIDPFDASAHALLGRRALERKDFATALVESLAALALGPPNIAEAHADVAEAYLGLGRREDARKSALKALEQAPTYARAQDLLLAAIGGR